MELNKALKPKSQEEIVNTLKEIKDPFNKLINSCFHGYTQVLENDLGEDYVKRFSSEASANAACGNNINVLKYLKGIGIDIHLNQNSSLKWGILYGSYDAVKFLLEDCDHIDYNNIQHALRMAKNRGDQEIISLLYYSVHKRYEQSVTYENK